MARVIALLAGLLVVSPGLLQADDLPAGTWKFVVPDDGPSPLWLIKLENKDKKWLGSVVASAMGLPDAAIEDVVLDKDLLSLKVKFKSGGVLRFEGRLPRETRDPVRILGSVVLGRRGLRPAHLERTTLTSLEQAEIDKEVLARQSVGYEVLNASLRLLKNASATKAKIEEVRSWAGKAARAGDAHGPLWHRQVMLAIAEILAEQEGYSSVALQYARQAERMLDDKESAGERRKVLLVLSNTLEKAGKADEAREVRARRDKITFVTTRKYAGRKASGGQTVLVELFTGAQATPCVATDLALAALEQTYRPSEVVLLQYHLHVSGPDPLSNPDAEARAAFYKLDGAPRIFFAGKQGPMGGGDFEVAQPRYDSYVETLNELLEQPARGRIKLTAVQKGPRIDIKADIAGLPEIKGDVRLRLALVEEVVSYSGGNTLTTHHCVVRGFAGGPAGLALKEPSTSKTATIDVDELRKKLNEYLEKFAKDEPFPSKDRPLEMKKLRVVAFVQNDDTKEVYQTAQVPVTQQ